MNAPDPQGDCDLRATYDSYYTSKEYQHRYPTPNIGTLAFLQRHVMGQCQKILDVGCGDGRYAIPILQGCNANVTGCDISAAALKSFRDAAAAQAISDSRFELLHHSVEQIHQNKSFDAMLMIFGVLGTKPDASFLNVVGMGALFGFFAYATYDLTNLAVIKNWSLSLTVLDMVWGTVLSGLATAAGKLSLDYLNR